MPNTKFLFMNSASLFVLTTISQYSLFLGIGLVFFSWIEKKEKLALAGQMIFVLLGILSLWVILTNTITIPEATGNLISKEVRMLIYFKLIALFSGFNLFSILLKFLKPRFHKISLYLAVFIGLSLFFMVFSILQMPK